jgi:hypothetical protein
MASLHKRPRSPFYYLKYRDKEGVIRFRSTGLRHDTEEGRKAAAIEKNNASNAELMRGGKVQTDGWVWVEKALKPLFTTEATKQRTLDRWDRILSFLLEKNVYTAADVTPQTALDYLEWRTTKKRRSGKTAARNTAIYEIRLFSRVMRMAVDRRKAVTNPLQNLRLAKAQVKIKPAFTEDEIAKVRAALPQQSEWMRIAFEISLATGCRLRETQIPLKCIDFHRETITFPAPKGGASKGFTIPMPTALKPLLESLKNKEITCKLPKMASKEFGRDFLHRQLGLKHLCFHCLRVTKITSMMREDVPTALAMRLVNHSDELVHKIYQRHSMHELMKYRDVGVSSANPQSPNTKSSPQKQEK